MFRPACVLAVLACLLNLVSPAMAGSAGVRNGGIQGVVYDDRGNPLPGASVVAVRQTGTPKIIRNATTDEMGNYFLGGMYLGEYTLGFAKFGYKTIDTSGQGASGSVTGGAIKVVVESGQTSIAQRVNLISEPDTTAANLTVTVLDMTTSAPVAGASVNLGAFAAAPGAAPGTYRLTARPTYDEAGNPREQTIAIIAEGFQPFTGQLLITANQTAPITFRLNPTAVEITGRVLASPPGPGVDLTKVAIRVPNLNAAFTNAAITPEGNFTLNVPASTPSIPRQFTLNFHLVGFSTATVPIVPAPATGTFTLTQDVILASEQINCTGNVFLSNSQPGGDSILIKELGQSFPISGGTYTIKLPAMRELTLQVTAMVNGRLETGEQKVTAQGDATTTFNLPPIFTRVGP